LIASVGFQLYSTLICLGLKGFVVVVVVEEQNQQDSLKAQDNNLDEQLIFYYHKKQLEFHVKGKKLAEHLMYDPQMSSSMSHQQRTIF